MKLNIIVFPLLIIIFPSKSAYQSNVNEPQSVKSLLNPKSSFQLAAINQFSDCFVFVINFRGLDINYRTITAPIVLLHYFSLPGKHYLYPIELNPYRSNTISEKQLTILASQSSQSSNSTLRIREIESVNYLDLLFRNLLRLGNKNTQCEAQVYLEPPTEHSQKSLFYESSYTGKLIKVPFWVYFVTRYVEVMWKLNFINTTPKYSILIYK